MEERRLYLFRLGFINCKGKVKRKEGIIRKVFVERRLGILVVNEINKKG